MGKEVCGVMSDEKIDARESQGLISEPQAEIKQHFGDEQNVRTKGGDFAARDLDKRTINVYLGTDKSEVALQKAIQELARLVEQIQNPDDIKRAYRDTLPVDSYLSRPEATDVAEMVKQLQEFRRLFEFIEQLLSDSSISQPIQDKLKELMQQFAQPEQHNRTQSAKLDAQGTLQSYLQIVLRPDRNSDEFVINGWLVPDDRINDSLKRFEALDIDQTRKGVSCKFEEIPKVLDQFLSLSLDRLQGKRCEMTIEVFLPLEHLCADVDVWKVTHPFFEEEFAVGTKYRIVVRSWERLDPRYLAYQLNQWYANWDRVKLGWDATPTDDEFEHLIEFGECNWKRLVHNLTQKLGLKLTCGLVEANKKDLFTCILKSATPIAIWARCDLLHLDQTAEINELLMAPLRSLLKRVLEKRLKADIADKPEDHLGSHLAMLWEDPYRLPPEPGAPLIPPGQ